MRQQLCGTSVPLDWTEKAHDLSFGMRAVLTKKRTVTERGCAERARYVLRDLRIQICCAGIEIVMEK